MATKIQAKTPSERLLDRLGPVGTFRDKAEYGDFGNPARATSEQFFEPVAKAGKASRLGPLEKIHVFWFAGMSCDGCSVSVTGATSPSVESLLMGAHPGLPRMLLHHTVLNIESGPTYLEAHQKALEGTLDAPYAIVLEGSIPDETKAGATGGYWSSSGEQPWGKDGAERPITTAEWIARLAPNAAAAIAIGTCATWGGIPASQGNPTGAMGLMDFLGKDYRSIYGLNVVNVPGCAPVGDNFTETVAAILYFLQGFGPLPEFDEIGRPAWLFGETVHRHCVRGAYYEEGIYAEKFGDKECLVEIGCWGPVVNCNITSRGAIRHTGGCMNSGGACIGCTMPGFPDKFTPFYKKSPGSTVSTTASKMVGSFIRPLRMYTNASLNREVRWDINKETPSGWATEKGEPNVVINIGHKVYDMMRRSNDRGKAKVDVWGRHAEADDTKKDAELTGGQPKKS